MSEATGRRWWRWAVQGGIVVAIGGLVARSLAKNWDQVRSLDVVFAVRPGLLLLAFASVLVTFLIQIESWRQLLAGLGSRLAFRQAAHAWSLANLGRYVPGKIWSLAGLVVLANKAGASTAAAGASAVASQAVALGAGAAVVAMTAPNTTALPGVPIGIALAVGTIALLTWDRPLRWVGRFTGASTSLSPLPVGVVFAASTLTLFAWMVYGVAFWLVVRGLVPGSGIGLLAATGVFALGYLLGWVAVFAPGGIGVREVVLIGLLAPALGSGAALAVSIGSRILLTLAEASAGALALLIGGQARQRSNGS